MAPREGEENQEINDISGIEEKIWNENGPMKPNETGMRANLKL